MLTKVQLEFIRRSLTCKGAVVPVEDGGDTVRVFVGVLDELDAQLRAIAALPASVNEPA